MPYVTGLQCHLCKTKFPAKALWVCDQCLGPLEVIYDYEAVRRDISREKIEARGKNLWRYRELLPIEGEPRSGLYSGYTGPGTRTYTIPEEATARLDARLMTKASPAALLQALSAYDAQYVVAAAHLEVRLITSDRRLLKAYPDIAIAPETFTA